MAEGRRDHVEKMLQRAASGVQTAVLKQGTPYKLVMHKPVDLHQQLATQRQTWQADLARLQGAVG